MIRPHASCRRLLGLCAFVVLSAAGCGGNADENYQSADLYGAYDAIAFGMSASLVESIIGTAPASKAVDGSGIALHRWEFDRGTRLYTTLLIQFEGDLGVVGKVITGPEGNKSEALDPT